MGVSYAVLGLYRVAAVPFAYALVVLGCIVLSLLVERFNLLAYTQLSLLLLLPFVVQWQIGGFVPAGGVMLWSILSPIGALFLFGGRTALWWFAAYIALTLGSLAYALTAVSELGWRDPAVYGLLIASVVLAAAFLWWEARAPSPMMPLGLFRSLTFSGANSNTFNGLTVNDGTVVLAKTAGVNAFAGALIVGDGAGAAGSATVRHTAANQIPNASAVTLGADGVLDLQGFTDAIASLTVRGGAISGTAGSRLDLGGNVTSSAIGSEPPFAPPTSKPGLRAPRSAATSPRSASTCREAPSGTAR